MNVFIITLVCLVTGSSILISVFVGEKYKSYAETLSALMITAFVLSNFSHVSLSEYDAGLPDIRKENACDHVGRTSAELAEEIIREELESVFHLKEIEVSVDMEMTEESVILEKVSIFVKGNAPLSEILLYTEKRFGLHGIVCVYKKDG